MFVRFLTGYSISEIEGLSEDMLAMIRTCLTGAAVNGRSLSLDLDMASLGEKKQATIQSAVASIAKKARPTCCPSGGNQSEAVKTLPKEIYFPYSRHSSYPELCHFVQAFRPKDVWPCTVSPVHWVKERECRFCFG